MRSVLYAPDMWVSLGHGDGKVFVTMPDDARGVDGDLQPATRRGRPLRGSTPSATPDRRRRDRRLGRDSA